MRITVLLLLMVTPVAANDLDLIAEQIMLIESGESATVDVAYCEGRMYAVRGTDRTAYNTWRLFLQCYGLNLEDVDAPIHPRLREIAIIYKDEADPHILTLWLFQVNRILNNRTVTLTLREMYSLPGVELWSNLMKGRIAGIHPIGPIRMAGYDPLVGRVETRTLSALLRTMDAHNGTKVVSEKIPIEPFEEPEYFELDIPSVSWLQIKGWLVILPVTIFGAFMLASLFRKPIIFAAGVMLLVICVLIGALIYVGPVVAVFLVAFAFFLKSIGTKGLTIQEWIAGLW